MGRFPYYGCYKLLNINNDNKDNLDNDPSAFARRVVQSCPCCR